MEHHTFGHADVEAKCIQMTELFSPHLNFFGGKLDIAEEALRGFILLDEVGMCPHSTMGSAIPWRQLESPPSLDGISVGLREQFLDEWLKVRVLQSNVEYVENVNNDDVTGFHGTILKCAKSIVEIGFLPGPGGHVKKGKYHEGAFMSKNFSPAFLRCDMGRHVLDDKIYSLESCPCVLEMRTSSALLVHYHKHNRDLCVLPGTRSKVLPGLRIEAVHFNTWFLQNYRQLEHSELRAKIKARGGVLETICGGHRQLTDFSSCGAVCLHCFNWA